MDEMVKRPVLSPWPTWTSSEKPVIMADLRRLSTVGCDFALFVSQSLLLKNGHIPDDTVIVRYPADSYEEYPNSFIIGPANESYVRFTCMVPEGKKLCPISQAASKSDTNTWDSR